MTAPQADTATDPQRIIAALRQQLEEQRAEREAAMAREAALAEALATRTAELAMRNSEFGDRIEHQVATIDVLKLLSSSPGDPQPAFDLIVRRARELCVAWSAGIAEFDGELVHFRAFDGPDLAAIRSYASLFPMAPTREAIACRAIMDRQLVHVRDAHAEPNLLQPIRDLDLRSLLALPLLRDGGAIGVIALTAMEPGGFSDSQIELLKTFAEQAVIAIGSAETYRALETRTADLQESLEYQTATSDVLKVISRSAFDLQPVLDTVAETAARLCDAEQAAIFRREGELVRLVSNCGFPPEYEALGREKGTFSIDEAPQNVGPRAIREGRVVHIHDAAAVPGYTESAITLGRQRTSLGVPLLREGEAIGVIVLARQRVEGFTHRQIELVSTFAAQAVIAMENARLIAEQREALEQQTATAEVLQVINASPGNLTPVFDTILAKAHSLCGAVIGALVVRDGESFRAVATRGLPDNHALLLRRGFGVNTYSRRLLEGERVVHIPDVRVVDAGDSEAARSLAENTNVRTSLWVPLRKDGRLLGFTTAMRVEVRLFSETEIALLENFAAQAVIAMENARLLTEQREALEQQTATAEVLQVINSSPGNLAPVFEAILHKAHTLCGATLGSLFLFDGELFRAASTHGYPEDLAQRLRQGVIHAATAQLLDASVPWVHNPDLTLVDGPTARAVSGRGGVRTNLMVPLRKDGKLLGTISCNRREVRLFTNKEIALLQNFAAQAVIAMENARLITEQREALEQQTATAEVLQVINTSPGELTPVFDAMLEKAHGLCGIAMGSLELYDGQRFRAVAVRGLSDAFADMLRQGYLASENPATRPLIDGGRLTHIRDLAETDYAITRSSAELDAARTLLCVPMRREGTLLGMIASARKEVRLFSDKEIALLENFAAQAVIAMENARLLNEQREALEQQTATAEVLQVINASPGNLTPVFDAVLEKTIRLCDSAFGMLATYDGHIMRYVATRGLTPGQAAVLADRPLAAGQPTGRIGDGENVVHLLDARDQDGYRVGFGPTRNFVDQVGARTAMWVALRKDKELLGILTIFRREVRAFADKEIVLVQNFAAQAVIAMENARLLDEIRQRQEELRVTFENMGDGVAMFDETQHLVAWNRKFQNILDVPDDIIARRQTFTEYVRYLAERGEYGPKADAEEQIRRLTERTGEYRAYERTRPDGRVIEIRHNPVPGGGFVLIYADITERKRNEAEIRAARDAAEEASRTIEAAYRELKTAQANLIQAEKMASLGQLTAGIAHEIKNPLNFVNNFSALSAELIDELQEVLAPEPLGETVRTQVEDLTALLKGNLEKVVQHGQRADGIVKSMLEHSRGSSDERRTVDLSALIDEALNLAYHGARAQDQSFNITLKRDFGDGIAPIEVNPQDMTRVFLNLFSNGFYAATRRARNAGDAGFVPMLKVATRDAGDAIEIRVRDNGTGIPGDIRDKLFQPFFTTKPTGEGTGLGLSITYDIVTQQHGGTITVESEVEEYSEFEIRLPRHP